eukprot:2420340-Prymnesium_polylepis.1
MTCCSMSASRQLAPRGATWGHMGSRGVTWGHFQIIWRAHVASGLMEPVSVRLRVRTSVRGG